MNTLLFLLMSMVSHEISGFPYPEFVVKCCPAMVMPGDTLYIEIVAKNPHIESIYLSNCFLPTDLDIQVRLQDSENQYQPLLFETEAVGKYSRKLIFTEIKPGDSRIIGALAINVPPLEDLKEPFWEKHLKSLQASNEKFLLCTTILSYSAADEGSVIRSSVGHEIVQDALETSIVTEQVSDKELIISVTKGDKTEVVTITFPDKYKPLPFLLEVPIAIKQRPEQEMILIREWHAQGQAHFPITQKYCKSAWTTFKSDMPQNTTIKDEKYSHWYFVRTGNRYQGDPNALTTWQDWQELEESLTSSTMQDEIRLTRILIQYCDTEDKKVLGELKEWFDGMNEVQRVVMAKSIRDRTKSTSGTKIFTQFRELYKTIRKYDVVAIPESDKKHLRGVGVHECPCPPNVREAKSDATESEIDVKLQNDPAETDANRE